MEAMLANPCHPYIQRGYRPFVIIHINAHATHTYQERKEYMYAVSQSNSEMGVLQEYGDSTLDLNVEPAWIQGITGCNVVVGVVDDGKHTILQSSTVMTIRAITQVMLLSF